MRIRDANATDLPEVLGIESAAFGTDAWSEPVVRAALTGRSDTRCSLVAERAGRLVGHAVLEMAGSAGDIHRLAVCPDCRREGVGSALLTALLAAARSHGCIEVFLEVRLDNPAALSLYSRFGFAELRRRRSYFADGTDAVVLRAIAPLSNVCDQR